MRSVITDLSLLSMMKKGICLFPSFVIQFQQIVMLCVCVVTVCPLCIFCVEVSIYVHVSGNMDMCNHFCCCW